MDLPLHICFESQLLIPYRLLFCISRVDRQPLLDSSLKDSHFHSDPDEKQWSHHPLSSSWYCLSFALWYLHHYLQCLWVTPPFDPSSTSHSSSSFEPTKFSNLILIRYAHTNSFLQGKLGAKMKSITS